MAIDEKSAGMILFRRAPDPLYLLLDYGKHWDFPKGHLEDAETARDAAIRELKEETGIDAFEIVPGFAREIIYFFRDKKKGLIRKTVVFFLGQTNEENVTLSDEHVGFAFLPYEEARRQLTYASARLLLRQVQEFIGAAHLTAKNGVES